MNKKIFLLILCLLISYALLFVGNFPDNCGCGFKFYIIPQTMVRYCIMDCPPLYPMTKNQELVNKILLKPTNEHYFGNGVKRNIFYP